MAICWSVHGLDLLGHMLVEVWTRLVMFCCCLNWSCAQLWWSEHDMGWPWAIIGLAGHGLGIGLAGRGLR